MEEGKKIDMDRTKRTGANRVAAQGWKGVGSWLLIAAAMVIASCSFDVTILSYDPARAEIGVTFFVPSMNDRFLGIDMDGQFLFDIELPSVHGLDPDFEILPDESLLILGQDVIYKYSLPNTIDWSYDAPGARHCVIPIPGGNVMYLYHYTMDVLGWDLPFRADAIREVDPVTGKTVWEWRTGDHLSAADFCPWHITQGTTITGLYDWTHANTIVFQEKENAVYLNLRHLDRLVKIDYPSGEVLWSMGDGGDFGEGLFSTATILSS